MSDAPKSKVSELLREGIRAAQAGEKEQARELLRQVVELDQYSEQGWFWLASVVETDEERRTCLGNVVVINPDNMKAQQLLERLEGMASGEISSTTEIIPGVDRRTSLIMIAIGAALLLVICGIILLTVVGGDDDGDSDEEQAGGDGNGGQVVAPTSTVPPTLGATNTPRPTIPPPPSETPRPSATPPPPTLMPPPENIAGRLVLGSGNEIGKVEDRNPYHDQPFYYVPAGDVTALSLVLLDDNIRGNSPSFSPDGSRLVYAQYLQQGGPVIQIYSSDGTKLADLSAYWNRDPIVFEQRMPAWSPIGNQVVFVGRVSGGIGANSDNLFLIDVPVTVPTFITPTPEGNQPAPTVENAEPAPSLLRILTDDTVNKLWPAWSPDGQQIVFVAEFSDHTDLLVMNLSDGSVRELTSDGDTHVESAPDWSGPDGNWVIYSATAEDNSGTDIWIVSLDMLGDVIDTGATAETDGDASEEEAVENGGEGTEGQVEELGPRMLFNFGPNDIEPRWSPDGRYIVFSSDRNGRRFDVFIYDFETGEVFKVTDDPDRTDVAHEWLAR